MFPPSHIQLDLHGHDIEVLCLFPDAEASVVDLPEPVGPDNDDSVCFIEDGAEVLPYLFVADQRVEIQHLFAVEKSITIFSPCFPGAVAHRNSMLWPSKRRRILPS